MAAREAALRVHRPRRPVASPFGVAGERSPAQDERRVGAAAQLAAVHTVLRRGPSLVPFHEVQDHRAAMQPAARNVVQLNGKKGTAAAAPAKLKGEDYANNVAQLVNEIAQLFAGSELEAFINGDISSIVDVISANRPKCAVDSVHVKGVDANAAAYGLLKGNITGSLAAVSNLFEESDREYLSEQIGLIQAQFGPLVDQLAAAAVDPRVALAIAGGQGGQAAKDAVAAINNALQELGGRLKKRLQQMLGFLLSRLPDVPSKTEKKDPPPPPAGGGGAIAVM